VISPEHPRQCVFRRHNVLTGYFKLAFWRFDRKIAGFMESQETTAEDFVFKLMPWFEANMKRLAYGGAAVGIIIFVYFYYSYVQNQKSVAAGEALTQAMFSSGGAATAEACLKVAADYPGTAAGRRALLQGATALFETGKYPEAQAQFEKYLNTYPDTFFIPQATLGVAACLDAQNKTDAAMSMYQKAANQVAAPSVVASAKFALGRIYESKGKLADAQKLFIEVTRAFPNSSVAAEAGQRAMELKAKLPAAPASPAPASPAAPAMPFNLSK
jgi:TolA-binding protein